MTTLIDPWHPYAPRIFPNVYRFKWSFVRAFSTTPALERYQFNINIPAQMKGTNEQNPGPYSFDTIYRASINIFDTNGSLSVANNPVAVVASITPSNGAESSSLIPISQWIPYMIGTIPFNSVGLSTHTTQINANRNIFGFSSLVFQFRNGTAPNDNAFLNQHVGIKPTSNDVGIANVFVRDGAGDDTEKTLQIRMWIDSATFTGITGGTATAYEILIDTACIRWGEIRTAEDYAKEKENRHEGLVLDTAQAVDTMAETKETMTDGT